MLFKRLELWCQLPNHNFKYEIGHNYCDCVEYTEYMNIFLPDYYILTVYDYPNNRYGCSLRQGKSVIVSMENITDLSDITELLGDYELL